MKTCGYCGAMDFMIEEETGREYCTRCGHYTGYCEPYGGINELGGDY
jgi:ribosomal protein S27AE